ncbi:alpha/beta hydrolase [Eionea flava]
MMMTPTNNTPLFYQEKTAFLKSLPLYVSSHPAADTSSSLLDSSPRLVNYLHHYGLDEVTSTRSQYYAIWQSPISTAEGTYAIVQQYWQAKTTSDASASAGTVVIAHGYLDHCGLYGRLIEWSLQQGYDVLCFDLPGHGLSSGEAASIKHFDTYTDVLEQVLTSHATLSHATAPNDNTHCRQSLTTPYIAIGQSTGCAVIANQLLRQRQIFEHAIFLAPLVRSFQWQWLRYLHKALSPIIHSIRRQCIASSHDNTFNDFLHNQDPLQTKRIPLTWLGAMDRWQLYCKQQKPTNNNATLAIIQGTQDTTVDWQHNIKTLHRIFPHARIHYAEGAKHHLVNESPDYWNRIAHLLTLTFKQQ